MMHSLAQRLIAEERRADASPPKLGHAAFRVCEKLRAPLCTCAGVVGFRSLLRRALSLAKEDVPRLENVQVNDDGGFEFSAELPPETAIEGGATIVEQLLTLLVTFIGEALTLRLVYDVWPKAAIRDSKPTGKKK
jgi:hypothetical protein